MFTSEIKNTHNEDISILVKASNHPWNYLCECGDASNLTIKEIQNCNAIFISHTHIDHFVNFDAVIRHQIGIQRRVVICGPENIGKQVQSRIQSYSWNLINEESITYEIREMISDTEIITYELTPPLWELKKINTYNSAILFEESDFIVTGVLLNHKIPSLAYQFTEKDTVKINLTSGNFNGGAWVKELKKAFISGKNDSIITINKVEYKAEDLFYLLNIQKGDSLGIIMDHAPSVENHQKIKKHFYGCNTVLIESFYKNEDQHFAILNYHSFAKMSGTIMKESAVKHPIPVHFSRKYSEEDIKILTHEFFEAYHS